MDCSSWKSSLQAYGILSVDTFFDDSQYLHLKTKPGVIMHPKEFSQNPARFINVKSTTSIREGVFFLKRW